MTARISLSLLVLGLLAPVLLATQALAIPAFSRQYKTECKTCHTIFPERNEFGDAFEKNSFVWPKELPAAAQAQQPQGQPADSPLVELAKGADALFNSGLPDPLPLSIMATYRMIYNEDKDPNFDLDGGTGMELFAGGNLHNQVGFWGEYGFGSSSIGDLSIQFRHFYDTPVNVKVGKFKPKLSLWKSNDRSSLSGFGHNSMRVGNNSFRLSGRQSAVELNAVLGSRLFAAAGVTNGSETDKAENKKNYYAHLSARIGGTDFLGQEPEVDLDHDSVWDFLTLTFGTFGYLGSSDFGANDFYRLGLEGELLYKRLKVRLSGTYGEDDDPSGTGVSVKSHYYLAQSQYLIGSNVIPAFRYEYQDIEGTDITQKFIPSISYAYLQNLRMILEYVHTEAPTGTSKAGTFQVALSF